MGVTDSGVKRLDVSNWLQPDWAALAFAQMEGSEVRPVPPEVWLREFLRPRLGDDVPAEVRDIFEVARGAFAYGYFFYPLYTLATDQLWRVGEAAIRHRCQQLGLAEASSRLNLRARIDLLVRDGAISQQAAVAWNALRELRNAGSHPTDLVLLSGPPDAVDFLHRMAADINELFAPKTAAGAAPPLPEPA